MRPERRSHAAVFSVAALAAFAVVSASAAQQLRALALRVPAADVLERLEAPHGSVARGLALVVADRRSLLLTLGPALVVFLVLVAAVARRPAPPPRRPARVALVALVASLAVVLVSTMLPWSAARDVAADALIIVAHGVLLWGALHVGPRVLDPISIGVAVGAFAIFGLVTSLVIGGQATKRLCWAAGPDSPYDRRVREAALARGWARLRNPLARASGAGTTCAQAARSLGLMR